jgi:hypothetical protein
MHLEEDNNYHKRILLLSFHKRRHTQRMTSSLLTEGEGANINPHRFRVAGMPLSAIAFLVLSAALMLVRSHHQLMWTDEFYPLESDSAASLIQVIHRQLTTPISLDPIVYNALAHFSIDLFGVGAFAIRLPSMCGYLLMQICLFYFVRRIAGERAATFALAIPALLGVVSYGVDARPYGLLLGLSALVMLSWQTAIRKDTGRVGALIVLSVSLALVINTHYYGVLLLIPLCGAELFRTFERRRVDLPMALSIGLGMVIGILVLLPFARAVSEFRAHYFAKGVDYHFITHAYLWVVIGYEALNVAMQHLLGAALIVVAAILLWVYKRGRSSTKIMLPQAEAVFLLMLTGLPIFGYLLAHFITKVIEARYVLPAVVGITALLAISMTPILQSKLAGRIVLATVFVAIAVTGVLHIRTAIEETQKSMAWLSLEPVSQQYLEATSAKPIYVMNPGSIQMISYYSRSANIRSRIALVYSRDEEMLNQHSNHLSLTAANMGADGVRNVVPYDSIATPGATDIFVIYRSPWDWTGRAFADAHAKVTYIGPAYGGDLVSVSFP